MKKNNVYKITVDAEKTHHDWSALFYVRPGQAELAKLIREAESNWFEDYEDEPAYLAEVVEAFNLDERELSNDFTRFDVRVAGILVGSVVFETVEVYVPNGVRSVGQIEVNVPPSTPKDIVTEVMEGIRRESRRVQTKAVSSEASPA